jgi:arylsulfatase A-like enzyme
MLIHFRGPDVNGHANNWPEYLNSISETDGYLWDVWNFLQAHEAYQDKTTLFVTNDHGRHLDHIKNGFISHGDHCEGCLHINLFTIGPDFYSGQVLDNQREIVDIAPTIAELLSFQIADNQGTILTELFKNN